MNTKKTSKLTTNIHFILDRSGSMEECKNAVIKGFNEYIKGLKNKKILFSLTTFDSMSTDTIYSSVNIKKVEPLDKKTFEPRGGTPLYDAAVDTIEKFADKANRDLPSLVVIMTDGEENSSREHDQDCFNNLVKELKARGNWTFVFMGANQDSWGNASKFGFSRNSVMDYAFDNAGIKKGFGTLAMSTSNFVGQVSASNMLSTEDFFDKGVK